MAGHEFAFTLPEDLYQRAQRAANLAHCGIEEILISALAETLPFLPDDLPSDLAGELTEWGQLNDEALRAIADATLSSQQQRRFSVLLRKESEGRLSEPSTGISPCFEK